MITEAQIEETIAQMEAEEFQDDFAQTQTIFWNYLNSDGFSGLTEKERQMMFFVHSTIYHTCKKQMEEMLAFDIEEFQHHEDQNWALREEVANVTEAIDQYFDGFVEEDLLAFVEDMLVIDEESEITELGKEVIFITAKSYIDFIAQENG